MANRVIRWVALLLCVVAPARAWAGIPVIDAGNLAQAIAQVNQAIAQLSELQKHYTQMQKQYEAVTSGRGLAGTLNSAAFQDYIPRDAKDLIAAARTKGYKGLTDRAKAMRDDGKAFDCGDMNAELAANCEREISAPYQYQALVEAALERGSERVDQINALMERAGSTTDAKEIAELQARIGAESALLQHELTQATLVSAAASGQRRIEEVRAREAQRANASRGSSLVDLMKAAK